MTETFVFDEAKHLYFLDGKALTGTTTVLQVIAKPALIGWAANQAVEYVISHALTSGPETIIVKRTTLEEAKSAHRKKKEKAGDWGTILHKHIENYCKEGTMPSLDGEMKEAFGHFREWIKDKKILQSEIRVYSRDLWVGGTCDVVVEIDGKVWLMDVKTSSGIYPEAFAQIASYDICLGEMGLYPEVEGYIILNLKKDGKMEEKRSVSNADNRKFFKAALSIYRLQEKIKNTI
jgi:hypothetical protein